MQKKKQVINIKSYWCSLAGVIVELLILEQLKHAANLRQSHNYFPNVVFYQAHHTPHAHTEGPHPSVERVLLKE